MPSIIGVAVVQPDGTLTGSGLALALCQAELNAFPLANDALEDAGSTLQFAALNDDAKRCAAARANAWAAALAGYLGGGGGGGVSSVGGTPPIASTGGTTPTISISAASGASAGSMSAADFTKLAGIASGATAYTNEDAQDAVGAMVASSSTVSLAYVDATPSLTAAVVAGSIGTTQLAAGGVTNAKRAAMAQATISGRADGAGTGAPQDLTGAQAADIVQPYVTSDTIAIRDGMGMFQ